MALVEQLIKNKHHLILSCLLVIFIAFDITIPEPLASIIDSIIGKIFVVGGALAIITANKFVGILALIAAYVLIVRLFFCSFSFVSFCSFDFFAWGALRTFLVTSADSHSS